METCTCINCYNKVVAKGLCETHYRRLRKMDQQIKHDLWIGANEKNTHYIILGVGYEKCEAGTK